MTPISDCLLSLDCIGLSTIQIISLFNLFLFLENIYPKGPDDQTTVSPIGPGEVPPPYQQMPQGGVPMVTCRVCQAMIDITSKRDQHVVKCHQCQEATVSGKMHSRPYDTNLH